MIINNTLTMCLPVPLLKFFVGIGAVVSGVLALGVLGCNCSPDLSDYSGQLGKILNHR